MKHTLAFLTGLLLLAAGTATSPAVVVYDTISGTVFSGGNGFNEDLEVGDEITLSSSSILTVTAFEIVIRNLGTAESFSVNFYANDGTSSEPGTVLWSSGLTATAASSPSTTYAFLVPSVVVPQTFTYTVVAGDGLSSTLLLNNGATTAVGTPVQRWTLETDSSWLSGPARTTFGFAARVTAVPEPSRAILSLLALGAVLMRRRRTA